MLVAHNLLKRKMPLPISDERLYAEVNAHILASATDTVRQVVKAWQTGRSRWGVGREWWWLIIQYDSGLYTAIAFEQLRDLLASPHVDVNFDTRLSALPVEDNSDWRNPKPGVIAARVVDKDRYSTANALHLAENAPGNMLIVTANGEFKGILSKRMRNFAMADLSLLNLLEELEAEEATSAPASTANPTVSPPDTV